MVAPTGIVTFLFTDIEGSIGRWGTAILQLRRVGDTAYETLARKGDSMSNAAVVAYSFEQSTSPARG